MFGNVATQRFSSRGMQVCVCGWEEGRDREERRWETRIGWAGLDKNWEDRTGSLVHSVNKLLTLFEVDLGLIPGSSYGPPAPSRSDPSMQS